MQRRDVNVVTLTGMVESNPTFVTVKNNKRILLFTLKVCEHFELFDGRPATHSNYFTVEVLGRNAEEYHRMLRIGDEINFSGYLRADDLNGPDKVRIRTYKIENSVIDDGN